MKRLFVVFLIISSIVLTLVGCGSSFSESDAGANNEIHTPSTEEQESKPSNLESDHKDQTTTGTIIDAVEYKTFCANVGGDFSIAIKEDGSVWTWGHYQSPSKVEIDNVISVSSGATHMLAIKNDGSLWAWGSAPLGPVLGVDTDVSSSNTPLKVMDDVVAASAGYVHNLVITRDGSLWAWGDNRYGQIGDGTTEDRTTPIKIMDNVIGISVGRYFSLAIKEDHSLGAWGWNRYGQIGDGTTEDRTTPIKIMDDVIEVDAGDRHSLAIKSDGSLWAWGDNSNGALGNGAESGSYAPITPTKIMDDVIMASAQGDQGFGHSHAIKSDGSLWSWGSNEMGRLGDGTTEDRFSPIKVMDDVIGVSAGGSLCLALKADGSLWGWGYNGALALSTDEEYVTVPTIIMEGVRTDLQ